MPGLLLDRCHHLRMAMPCGDHRDPRREIEEFVSVGVLDHRATPRFGYQRIIARIGGRHHTVIPFDQLFRLRAGRVT